MPWLTIRAGNVPSINSSYLQEALRVGFSGVTRNYSCYGFLCFRAFSEPATKPNINDLNATYRPHMEDFAQGAPYLFMFMALFPSSRKVKSIGIHPTPSMISVQPNVATPERRGAKLKEKAKSGRHSPTLLISRVGCPEGRLALSHWMTSVVRALSGTGPPDPILESTSPSPPQGSIWHRNRVKSGDRYRINVESMPIHP